MSKNESAINILSKSLQNLQDAINRNETELMIAMDAVTQKKVVLDDSKKRYEELAQSLKQLQQEQNNASKSKKTKS